MSNNSGQARGQLTGQRPPGWHYYFPSNEYSPEDRRTILINELTNFFCSPNGWPVLKSVRSRFSTVIVTINWVQLVAQSGISDLPEAMYHAPSEALACLGAAAHAALYVFPPASGQLPTLEPTPCKVRINLVNHQSSFILVSAVRADQVGRLVTIRGTVSRATPIQPLVTSVEFICAKCGSPNQVPFKDGRCQFPTSCKSNGCRSRTLAPNRASAACIDWQRIQIQGLPRDEGRAGEGKVPRHLDVELLDDLVEKCSPGEVVTITGIVKVLQGEPRSSGRGRFGSGGGDAKRQCLFLPYVEAVSVVKGPTSHDTQNTQNNNNNSCITDSINGDAQLHHTGYNENPVYVAEPEGVSYLPPNMPGFTALDLDFIRAFTASCEGGDQLRQLVHSLAPGICGMEAQKAGILLAMFGGVPRNSGATSTSSPHAVMGKNKPDAVPVRGDIHVLLVGDPGLGKSQLLQAAASAAPRGVYVCGSATSSAGLTVSVVRNGGDFCFDPGALVLADRGVCCVDEFDKATSEHAAMLGAMEQQEVAVAKAGLVASLPARTTVIAAANPVDGHYNRGKTIMQNVKMSPAMLSRFDLVFLLLDRPDAQRDVLLTEHIMSAHAGLAGRTNLKLLEAQNHPLLLTDVAAPGEQRRQSLRERLKQQNPDDEPLPPQLLRKYIAYARQYVHPVLTPEAATVIKEFYLLLRSQSAADPAAPPVTHRQLESLIRLAEARARVDLREQVTKEDAEDAVDIMKESLAGMICDGPSMIDFGVGALGGSCRPCGAGFQTERRRFIEALHRHCAHKGSTELEVHELYTVADRIELALPDTSGFIERLNDVGDLLKKGGGKYVYNGSGAARMSSARLSKPITDHSSDINLGRNSEQAPITKRALASTIPGGDEENADGNTNNTTHTDEFDW